MSLMSPRRTCLEEKCINATSLGSNVLRNRERRTPSHNTCLSVCRSCAAADDPTRCCFNQVPAADLGITLQNSKMRPFSAVPAISPIPVAAQNQQVSRQSPQKIVNIMQKAIRLSGASLDGKPTENAASLMARSTSPDMHSPTRPELIVSRHDQVQLIEPSKDTIRELAHLQRNVRTSDFGSSFTVPNPSVHMTRIVTPKAPTTPSLSSDTSYRSPAALDIHTSITKTGAAHANIIVSKPSLAKSPAPAVTDEAIHLLKSIGDRASQLPLEHSIPSNSPTSSSSMHLPDIITVLEPDSLAVHAAGHNLRVGLEHVDADNSPTNVTMAKPLKPFSEVLNVYNGRPKLVHVATHEATIVRPRPPPVIGPAQDTLPENAMDGLSTRKVGQYSSQNFANHMLHQRESSFTRLTTAMGRIPQSYNRFAPSNRLLPNQAPLRQEDSINVVIEDAPNISISMDTTEQSDGRTRKSLDQDDTDPFMGITTPAPRSKSAQGMSTKKHAIALQLNSRMPLESDPWEGNSPDLPDLTTGTIQHLPMNLPLQQEEGIAQAVHQAPSNIESVDMSMQTVAAEAHNFDNTAHMDSPFFMSSTKDVQVTPMQRPPFGPPRDMGSDTMRHRFHQGREDYASTSASVPMSEPGAALSSGRTQTNRHNLNPRVVGLPINRNVVTLKSPRSPPNEKEVVMHTNSTNIDVLPPRYTKVRPTAGASKQITEEDADTSVDADMIVMLPLRHRSTESDILEIHRDEVAVPTSSTTQSVFDGTISNIKQRHLQELRGPADSNEAPIRVQSVFLDDNGKRKVVIDDRESDFDNLSIELQNIILGSSFYRRSNLSWNSSRFSSSDDTLLRIRDDLRKVFPTDESTDDAFLRVREYLRQNSHISIDDFFRHTRGMSPKAARRMLDRITMGVIRYEKNLQIAGLPSSESTFDAGELRGPGSRPVIYSGAGPHGSYVHHGSIKLDNTAQTAATNRFYDPTFDLKTQEAMDAINGRLVGPRKYVTTPLIHSNDARSSVTDVTEHVDTSYHTTNLGTRIYRTVHGKSDLSRSKAAGELSSSGEYSSYSYSYESSYSDSENALTENLDRYPFYVTKYDTCGKCKHKDKPAPPPTEWGNGRGPVSITVNNMLHESDRKAVRKEAQDPVESLEDTISEPHKIMLTNGDKVMPSPDTLRRRRRAKGRKDKMGCASSRTDDYSSEDSFSTHDLAKHSLAPRPLRKRHSFSVNTVVAREARSDANGPGVGKRSNPERDSLIAHNDLDAYESIYIVPPDILQPARMQADPLKQGGCETKYAIEGDVYLPAEGDFGRRNVDMLTGVTPEGDILSTYGVVFKREARRKANGEPFNDTILHVEEIVVAPKGPAHGGADKENTRPTKGSSSRKAAPRRSNKSSESIDRGKYRAQYAPSSFSTSSEHSSEDTTDLDSLVADSLAGTLAQNPTRYNPQANAYEQSIEFDRTATQSIRRSELSSTMISTPAARPQSTLRQVNTNAPAEEPDFTGDSYLSDLVRYVTGKTRKELEQKSGESGSSPTGSFQYQSISGVPNINDAPDAARPSNGFDAPSLLSQTDPSHANTGLNHSGLLASLPRGAAILQSVQLSDHRSDSRGVSSFDPSSTYRSVLPSYQLGRASDSSIPRAGEPPPDFSATGNFEQGELDVLRAMDALDLLY